MNVHWFLSFPPKTTKTFLLLFAKYHQYYKQDYTPSIQSGNLNSILSSRAPINFCLLMSCRDLCLRDKRFGPVIFLIHRHNCNQFYLQWSSSTTFMHDDHTQKISNVFHNEKGFHTVYPQNISSSVEEGGMTPSTNSTLLTLLSSPPSTILRLEKAQ